MQRLELEIRLCKIRMSISTTQESDGITDYMIGDRLAPLVSFGALFPRDAPTGRRIASTCRIIYGDGRKNTN